MDEGKPAATVWTRSLRDPVTDINEQLVDWLCQQARGARAASPRLAALLEAGWERLDLPAIQVLAATPCVLIDAGFEDPGRWEHVAPAVGDCPANPYFADAGGAALVRRTLLYGWHLARSAPTAARVLLAMAPMTAVHLAGMRLRDLEALAESRPVWIAPRWERTPRLWRQMIDWSLAAEPAVHALMHQRSVQLVAAGWHI